MRRQASSIFSSGTVRLIRMKFSAPLPKDEPGMTGEDFAWTLLREEHVAVMPGSSFGNEAENFIRMSLTVPDEKIEEACRRIVGLAGRTGRKLERRA